MIRLWEMSRVMGDGILRYVWFFGIVIFGYMFITSIIALIAGLLARTIPTTATLKLFIIALKFQIIPYNIPLFWEGLRFNYKGLRNKEHLPYDLRHKLYIMLNNRNVFGVRPPSDKTFN